MPKEPAPETERDELAPTELGPTEREQTEVGQAQAHATTAPDTVAEAPGIGIIGRFRLHGNLGSGGMADVYRAYDPTLDLLLGLDT